MVWSIRFDGMVSANPDSARTRALDFKSDGIHGYAIDPLAEGPGYRLSVGAFPDSATASAASLRLGNSDRTRSITGPFSIVRRPVSGMLGQFDFGSVNSPDGRHQLFFRTHPHMFQPYMASEVWVRQLPAGRPRLLIRSMASF
jgi:hypothetical protein